MAVLTMVISHGLSVLLPNTDYANFQIFKPLAIGLLVLIIGFCWHWSFLHRPITYFKFLRSKVLKAYLPYVLFVFLVFVIGHFFEVYPHGLDHFWGHVLLYKMFHEGYILSYGEPLGWFATLVQFYLFFFILKELCSDLGRLPFLGFTFVLSILWVWFINYMGYGDLRVWNGFFLNYLWLFGLGMGLASWLHQKGKIIIKNKRLLGFGSSGFILAVIIGLFMGVEIGPFTIVFKFLAYLFVGVCLYLSLGIWVNKFVIAYGKRAYAFYLWFFLCDTIITYFIGREYFFLTFSLSFLVASVLGLLYSKICVWAYRCSDKNAKTKGLTVGDVNKWLKKYIVRYLQLPTI